jgi:HlyD family secretion protein
MDKQRDPAILKRKKRNRMLAAGVVGVAVVALTVAVSRLEPAAPTVADSESVLYFGTVKRGPFTREVRGAGTLKPDDIRWITATTSGRVERIVLHPGAEVQIGTVLLELSNPDLEKSVRNAEMSLKTALANLENQRTTLANARLQQEANIADFESTHEVAQADLQMNQSLAEGGLVSKQQLLQKQAVVNQAKNRLELAKKQHASAIETANSQLAPSEAAANQARAEVDSLTRQLGDLRVKSTMAGRLQLVQVEVGASVNAGAQLARVSDPTRLKAEVRISETQTRDLAIGQLADIDTRNGHVKGKVARIDPASNQGTVGVDVTLEGPLPAGARPDLGIDGTIELERLTNVLYVESPAFGQENSTISLFKVLPTREAVRTPVKIGRRSVTFVEVVEGLVEGDRVVLSDMSQYDSFDRLRLN